MSDENITKHMGQLLRKGAALLNVACPKCNTPLLRLKDATMYCAKCDKQVVEQKATTAGVDREVVRENILNALATRTLSSLENLLQSLPEQPHPEEIRAFASVAKDLIEILRGIQKLQR
ncbi:MAG: Sjogren's syndrome/scleroderma autoantigen 1 family protein [Candidatus Hodarchaeota archaeon]